MRPAPESRRDATSAHPPHAVAADAAPRGRIALGTPVALGADSALSNGLNLPLAALRASMESLSHELALRDAGRTIIRGALEEVDRIGRNVRDLVEFVVPPVPLPLRCTVVEIALSVRRALPEEQRQRVVLAHASPGAHLVVDGPLLAKSLRRLVENALEARSDDVLLVSRQERDGTHFAVVDRAPAPFDPAWSLSAYRTTKSAHLGLGLSLARRDLELLGGALTLRRSLAGGTCAVATIFHRSEP